GFVSFFQERFAAMTSTSDGIALLAAFLLRKLMMLGKQAHLDFLNSIDKLLQNPNQFALGAVSVRQLARLFQKHMGLAPKQTAKLIRFQKVLQALYENPCVPGDELAYLHWFTDQAYLIKLFK
ncbi:helix-turn-helix domain-containing protein, partial [Listeria monocytogenes]|uniref:helix-turn-helix domain-containing protein n=1 Tax=Listeria monocytogenes TaxID=1639 RepID=UPI00122D77B6